MKKSILTQTHINLGAKMANFANFLMPLYYRGAIIEHKTVRNAVGLFDVSHMGEVCIKGKRAFEYLQKISTNDASKLSFGKAQYSCMTYKNGGIVDDMIVYCVSDEEYILVINAANIEKDLNWLNLNNSFDIEIKNVSNDTCLLALQGPKAINTLQKITNIELKEIPFYNYRISKVSNIENIVISATGYTGSGGFELYCKNNQVKKLWNDLLIAGKEFGIMPCGLVSRDSLRLEMGYCLYGNEIDSSTNPLEAGLGWITKFTKDFIGSDALLKLKKEGVNKKLVAFQLTEKGIPRSGYKICSEKGDEIGIVTSGGISPCLGLGIGLGYVDTKYIEIGMKIAVLIRDKMIKTQIVRLPFYKH